MRARPTVSAVRHHSLCGGGPAAGGRGPAPVLCGRACVRASHPAPARAPAPAGLVGYYKSQTARPSELAGLICMRDIVDINVNGPKLTIQANANEKKKTKRRRYVLQADAAPLDGMTTTGHLANYNVEQASRWAAALGRVLEPGACMNQLSTEGPQSTASSERANSLDGSTVVVLNAPLGIRFKHNRITGVVQGGNADASGQVSIGMAILAVNTQSCRGMSQSDIMGLIKAQGGQRIYLQLGKVGLNSMP